MGISLLLVTPQASLGDVIRKALKNVGEFDLRVTDDFADGLKITRQRGIPLAFLDAELEDHGISLVDVGYALRQLAPKIQIIIITNARSYLPDSVSELTPRAFLHKPMDPDELARVVADIFPPPPKSIPAAPKPAVAVNAIPWLDDVNRAAQHLTRLTLESSAQAALITRADELWAYAGQLSRAAAEELTQTIKRYWDHEEKSDLLRFVRLAATNAQHMLYATRLTSDMILALVFDSETPFSTIRAQAGKLAGSLASTPPDAAASGPRKPAVQEEVPSDLPHLSEVLSDVPPPNPPPRATLPSITVPLLGPDLDAAPVKPDQPKGKWEPETKSSGSDSRPASNETSRSQPVAHSPAMSAEPEYEIASTSLAFEDDEDLAVTRKHAAFETDQELAETRKQTSLESKPPSVPRSLTETVSDEVRRMANKVVLEPISPSLYNLSYACLLIPRFERHYLTGDLAEHLNDWLRDISIAFSWRLEYIAVRPEYFQWISNVPPSASPGSIMRVVRQETSNLIFAEFPRFARENPSGDFWAPGYLIMGGPQPHPQKLIKDFIKQTRRHQGLSGPR